MHLLTKSIVALVGGVALLAMPALAADKNKLAARLVLDGQNYPVAIDGTPAGRSFFALLPLTLTLSDYNATEKVADLPGKLDTAAAPDGFTPQPGDLTQYVPWGNLAIFYRNFRYSPGLVRLGRLESANGLAALARQKGDFAVRIEQAE